MKLLWLGETRGALTDWTTQSWVCATGRKISLDEMPWLAGPIGKPTGIGRHFFERYAVESGLEVRRDPPRGLLPSCDLLRGPSFEPDMLHPMVRSFYEETSQYEMEAWAEWCGAFRPFGGLLAWFFSRRLQQLNVPLSPLDTSRGTTSDVLHLVDPVTGRLVHAAWVRQLKRTGHVLYAGCYGVTRVPGYPGQCVQVVFPLPNGNGIVILKPEIHPTGALTVTSSGRGFGDPGFYFTVQRGGKTYARYVRTMQESIHVFPGDSDSEVRADHTMQIWGRVFMRLHYRLARKQLAPIPQP